MKPLVVDVSPLAINRTAMYFVVRDSVRHLVEAGLADEVVAAGERLSMADLIANDFDLGPADRLRAQRRISRLISRPRRTASRTLAGRPHLVFDPLYLLTVPSGTPAAVFVLDLTPRTRPEWHPPAVSRAYAGAFTELGDPLVDILSISHSTTRDLWANLGIAPSHVRTIHLYDRLGPRRRPDTARERSLLFVGSLEARKNVDGLILAFASSGLAASGYELRIVGGDAHGSERVTELARQVPGVTLRGRLSDAELAYEYDACTALVYPSHWEGFGLPAIEALGRGIPVLLSDSGALPEVGGTQAVYVDPCNLRSIADGLVDIVKSAEDDDEEAIRERLAWAATFSQERYLANLVEAVQSMTGRAEARRDGGPPAVAARRTGPRPSRSPAARPRSRVVARRVVPATLGAVPGDSFSFDYLHGLQQEARVEVSRRAAAFRSGSLLAYPWYAARLLAALARLQARNVVIKSMVNELVARKLDERLRS